MNTKEKVRILMESESNRIQNFIDDNNINKVIRIWYTDNKPSYLDLFLDSVASTIRNAIGEGYYTKWKAQNSILYLVIWEYGEKETEWKNILNNIPERIEKDKKEVDWSKLITKRK